MTIKSRRPDLPNKITGLAHRAKPGGGYETLAEARARVDAAEVSPNLDSTGHVQIPGWELLHTGGNCTGLQRAVDERGRSAVDGRWYWFLTDGDPSAPQSMGAPCALILYGADGFAVESVDYPTVGAALLAVAAAEGRAVEVIQRAISVIEEGDPDAATDPEGHAPLLAELRRLIGGARG